MSMLVYYTDKSIYRYMAKEILCKCLEATSRLQSCPLYLSTTCAHTHADVVVTPFLYNKASIVITINN